MKTTHIDIYQDANGNCMLESDYKINRIAHQGFDKSTSRKIKSITTIANPAKKIDEEWRKYQQLRNSEKRKKMIFRIGIN